MGTPNGQNKGLSIKIDDVENIDDATERRINSNGVNIVNGTNGDDYLTGFGFENGIESKSKDSKKKNFYFKLPDDAKSCVSKQAESLEIPKTSFVLMLGVLTQNGPIPINHYRSWKLSNPNIANIVNVNSNKSVSSISGPDIVPNLDSLTDSSDKNSDALISNKSVSVGVGEISLANNGSPVGSIGSTPAAALFADASSNGNGSTKRTSPLSNGAGSAKKTTKK